MSKKFSIQKGYDQVQRKDLEPVKNKIMTILGIRSRTSWGSYLRGDIEPRASQAEAIKEVFKQHQITDMYE